MFLIPVAIIGYQYYEKQKKNRSDSVEAPNGDMPPLHSQDSSDLSEPDGPSLWMRGMAEFIPSPRKKNDPIHILASKQKMTDQVLAAHGMDALPFPKTAFR